MKFKEIKDVVNAELQPYGFTMTDVCNDTSDQTKIEEYKLSGFNIFRAVNPNMETTDTISKLKPLLNLFSPIAEKFNVSLLLVDENVTQTSPLWDTKLGFIVSPIDKQADNAIVAVTETSLISTLHEFGHLLDYTNENLHSKNPEFMKIANQYRLKLQQESILGDEERRYRGNNREFFAEMFKYYLNDTFENQFSDFTVRGGLLIRRFDTQFYLENKSRLNQIYNQALTDTLNNISDMNFKDSVNQLNKNTQEL